MPFHPSSGATAAGSEGLTSLGRFSRGRSRRCAVPGRGLGPPQGPEHWCLHRTLSCAESGCLTTGSSALPHELCFPECPDTLRASGSFAVAVGALSSPFCMQDTPTP